MKKHIFTLASLFALGTLSAQVRTVNSATNVSVTNSPAFIDASSNTTVNGSANVGKGLIFPRVDLSAMTAFPGVTAGIANSFPTRFDGMIVYNTASSGTAGVGATQGTLSPGYWYYENKSSSNTGGTWKPMGASVEPWYNAATNTAATGNTQDIYQMGKVGIGTATPGSSLDVKGSLAAQYNAVTATSYAMTATDYHVSYNGTANAAFTLPAAVAGAGNFKGRMYTIKNNTAFTITITPAGSETINGTPSLTLAANQSVQMINTGLTGAAATWEVLEYNSTSSTGATCVPEYVVADIPAAGQTISAVGNIIQFNNVLASNGSLMPNASGIFTLKAGNTYRLYSSLYGNFTNGTSGTMYWDWVDATTETKLAGSTSGLLSPLSYTNGTGSVQPVSEGIYTPTADQTIKVRVSNITGSVGLSPGTYCRAVINQLNACNAGGGNTGSSSSVTASNGLTASSGDVKLGGTLSQATTVTNNGNALNIAGSGSTSTFASNGYVGVGTTAPTSMLHANGSFATRYVTVNSDTTLDGTYHTVNAVHNSGTVTLTLPPVSGITGRQYTLQNNAGGTTNVVVSGGGTIEGLTTLALTQVGQTAQLIAGNSEWQLVTHAIKSPVTPSGVNIYSADGTLNSNRTVDLNSKTLTFNNGDINVNNHNISLNNVRMTENSGGGTQILTVDNNGWARATVNPTINSLYVTNSSNVNSQVIRNLTGTNTRIVTADASGNIQATENPYVNTLYASDVSNVNSQVIRNLAGTNTRIVTADASGNIQATENPYINTLYASDVSNVNSQVIRNLAGTNTRIVTADASGNIQATDNPYVNALYASASSNVKSQVIRDLAGSGNQIVTVDNSGNIQATQNIYVNSLYASANLDIYNVLLRQHAGGGSRYAYIDNNGYIQAGTGYPSDIRLKENINPILNGLDKVLALRPVTYDWKKDAKMNDHKQLGFIAQELKKVVPEVVYMENRNGYKDLNTVNYEQLTALLTKAIQEQQAEIEILKKEIKELQKK